MTMEREEHMTASSREKGDFWTKEESDQDQHKLSLVPSSSRRWSAFRNPRIVRVSRTFGGKDRHSKVCTVRGLRDRRIRLSVPTAVQLYELQDKLGVGQPSKVIDWLIEATKHEIDKLPPLQMPPGFGGFPLISPEIFGASRSSLAQFFDTSSSAPALLKHGLIHPLFSSKNAELNKKDDDLGGDEGTASRSNDWDMNDDLTRLKGKEVDSSWEFHQEKHKFVDSYVPTRLNFLPLPNLSAHTLSFSHQVGNQFGFASHTDHQNPFIDDSSSIAASLSLSTNVHHNLSYVSPSTATPVMPHLFPPYNNAVSHPQLLENNFQLFSSAFTPSLHLIGSSPRPTLGEYVKLYRSENKTDNPPSI